MKKVWEFISKASHSRTTAVLVILILFASVPLTVFIAQQQQQTQQHASSFDYTIICPVNFPGKPNGVSDNELHSSYHVSCEGDYSYKLLRNRVGQDETIAGPLPVIQGSKCVNGGTSDISDGCVGITNHEFSSNPPGSTNGLPPGSQCTDPSECASNNCGPEGLCIGSLPSCTGVCGNSSSAILNGQPVSDCIRNGQAGSYQWDGNAAAGSGQAYSNCSAPNTYCYTCISFSSPTTTAPTAAAATTSIPATCGGVSGSQCANCGGVASYAGSRCGGYDASSPSHTQGCLTTNPTAIYQDVYYCNKTDSNGRNYDVINVPSQNSTCGSTFWCPSETGAAPTAAPATISTWGLSCKASKSMVAVNEPVVFTITGGTATGPYTWTYADRTQETTNVPATSHIFNTAGAGTLVAVTSAGLAGQCLLDVTASGTGCPAASCTQAQVDQIACDSATNTYSICRAFNGIYCYSGTNACYSNISCAIGTCPGGTSGCTTSSYIPALSTFCGNKAVTTNCNTSVTMPGTLTCPTGQTCSGGGTLNACGTPATGGTVLTLSIGLDGVGSTGDRVNATSATLTTPIASKQTIQAFIHISDNNSGINTDITRIPTTLTYNAGKYNGTVSIPSTVTGTHNIRIEVAGHLIKKIGVTTGAAQPLSGNLFAGDINGDNQISILDYSILVGCWFPNANGGQAACGTHKEDADLNADGAVNQLDYNLFLRDYSVQDGE